MIVVVEVVVVKLVVVVIVVEVVNIGGLVEVGEEVEDDSVEENPSSVVVVLGTVEVEVGIKVNVVVVGSGCVVVVLDDVGKLDVGGSVETCGSLEGVSLLVVVVFSHVSTVVDTTGAELVSNV